MNHGRLLPSEAEPRRNHMTTNFNSGTKTEGNFFHPAGFQLFARRVADGGQFVVAVRRWLTCCLGQLFQHLALSAPGPRFVSLFYTFSAPLFAVVDDLSVFHINKLFHAPVERAYGGLRGPTGRRSYLQHSS